jgi:restriction system protein
VGNYWALSAGKDGELWSTFWLERKVAIGWSAIGDLSRFSSRDLLATAYKKTYPDDPPRRVGMTVSQLWRFCREIRKDDTVFVHSHGMLIGIAKVVGDYEFIWSNSPLRTKFHSPYFDDDYPHIRSVHWISLSGAMKQPLTVTRVTEMVDESEDD